MWKFLLVLIPLTVAFQDYTPETYPNSLTQPQACGLTEPGFVCDPSGVLAAENGTALQLIHYLVEAQHRTNCSCHQNPKAPGVCDNSGTGFIFSVALTKRMVLNEDERDRQSVMKAAMMFAETLREQQPRGHCQDDILIFISQNDRAVWTSVGMTTQERLSTEMINSITTHAARKAATIKINQEINQSRVSRESAVHCTLKLKPNLFQETFFEENQYYEGLKYMIDSYVTVLRGEKLEITPNKGWYWPLPLWAIITIGVVVCLILLAVLGLSIWCCVKKCCNKDRRGNYQMTARM